MHISETSADLRGLLGLEKSPEIIIVHGTDVKIQRAVQQ